MASAWNGTISGQGSQALTVPGVRVTDVDIILVTLGPHVSAKGPSGFRKLQMAGWIMFYLGSESVYDPIFLNWEAQDTEIHGNSLAVTADGFHYYVNPGTSFSINVSY